MEMTVVTALQLLPGLISVVQQVIGIVTSNTDGEVTVDDEIAALLAAKMVTADKVV